MSERRDSVRLDLARAVVVAMLSLGPTVPAPRAWIAPHPIVLPVGDPMAGLFPGERGRAVRWAAG